jgi:hypothetical protein
MKQVSEYELMAAKSQLINIEELSDILMALNDLNIN